MSRLAILASVMAVAVISVACAGTGGQSNSASSMLAGPSALAASPSDEGAVSAPAAKGGNGGGKGPSGSGQSTSGSTLALVMVADNNGDGTTWGDTITFAASTSTTDPHVTLACYQNGQRVLSAWAPYVASSPQQWTLSTPSWQGGAADCTAELVYFSGSKDAVLATTSFAVGA